MWANRAIISRGLPRFFASQKTLAQDDNGKSKGRAFQRALGFSIRSKFSGIRR